MKFSEMAKNETISESMRKEMRVDNPELNFTNSQSYNEKQKFSLKEKMKQSSSSVEHFKNLMNI